MALQDINEIGSGDEGKDLYHFQEKAISEITQRISNSEEDYNLLYQLPTGGGKTVIFSEITRRYIQATGKKVLILTHRVELCHQTSDMLSSFGVTNMIISSKIKEVKDDNDYMCFVAMVETLNNRLQEEKVTMKNVGLVIIDEAHYNSFRKLFKYFKKVQILGVTATPLSSNIKLPMKDNYNDLNVVESINTLKEKGFLAKATNYSYNLKQDSLKIGMNGDYTVKSSEKLYGNLDMLEKLLHAYEEQSMNKKTLIFNNGIETSYRVYDTFKEAGYDVRHLDHTAKEQDRRTILKWFKETPNAILTSVGILTTGFDEPTVETVILNRATKSLTLYHQMIGRGSRVLPNKKEFSIIDLGNNLHRFGLWNSEVDWYHIFHAPHQYYESLQSDENIERQFKYEMPTSLLKKFKNTPNVKFDVQAEYEKISKKALPSKLVIEKSIEQHAQMCIENSDDMWDALALAKELGDDIDDRIRRYSYCITNGTKNYINWLQEDYRRKLKSKIRQEMPVE